MTFSSSTQDRSWVNEIVCVVLIFIFYFPCFITLYAFTSALHCFTLKVMCGNERCVFYLSFENWGIFLFWNFENISEVVLRCWWPWILHVTFKPALKLLKHLFTINMCLFVPYWYSCCFSKKKKELNYGKIQKQWSPLASGSRWRSWHTDLRMLLGQLIASKVIVLGLMLNLWGLCLLQPPLYFEWYNNVTVRVGVSEHISGHECCDATCQRVSNWAAPSPLPKIQV